MSKTPVLTTQVEFFSHEEEPDDYGEYLVVPLGSNVVTSAYYGHPIGQRKTGWYEIGGYYEMDIRMWAKKLLVESFMSDDYVANPWVPMSDPSDLKAINKLGEECGELSSAISRCTIQGIDEAEPVTGKINRQWLTEELADVIATAQLAIEHFDLDEAFIKARAARKKAILKPWYGM